MSSSTSDGTPEELQRDIEAQREQLARTVDQLSAKLDVKAQARARLAHVRAAATTPDGQPRPQVIAGAGAALAAVVGGILLVVRRRRH